MKKLRITEMNRLSPDEFRAEKKIPFVVVLDNVRSMHNIGSVFRTCDAFLTGMVYLCGISGTPPNAEIHKTALGAENTVEWKYFADALKAVQELKDNGYTLVAVEQAHGSTMLPDFRVEQGKKYAVILGNEVKGVQQQIIDCCDLCLEIPQFGTKHSLNVSVTAGIIIWEFFKRLS